MIEIFFLQKASSVEGGGVTVYQHDSISVEEDEMVSIRVLSTPVPMKGGMTAADFPVTLKKTGVNIGFTSKPAKI